MNYRVDYYIWMAGGRLLPTHATYFNVTAAEAEARARAGRNAFTGTLADGSPAFTVTPVKA